ncbi:uncharacterized protein A4U43_C01F21450 [Asparagus officinalis]|uniref:Uncharacterized protein n=1 Tax=Asparagus officinalis TaxID=4686 RepID=A0A5P1FVH7_ASPOF|nr:uncharacterized protein A4U43_C01F21450 [Asparagus officinalis]
MMILRQCLSPLLLLDGTAAMRTMDATFIAGLSNQHYYRAVAIGDDDVVSVYRAYDHAAIKFQGVDADSNFNLSARFTETRQALVSSVDKIIFVGSPGVGKMVTEMLDAVMCLF